MKNLILPITGILYLSLFIQCKDDTTTNNSIEKIQDNMVRITGFIHNRDKYPDTKELIIEIPYLSSQNFKIATPIDDKGNFKVEFELVQAQEIYIKPYIDFLYVVPDDSFNIELDFNDLMKAEITGGKSEKINSDFHLYFDNTFYRRIDYGVGTENEMNLSFKEIRKIISDKKADHYEKRNTLLDKTQIDKDVEFLTESMIELDYNSALIDVVFKRIYHDKNYMDPNKLLKEIEQNTTKYFSKGIYCDSHFNFISHYIYLKSVISQPELKITYYIPDNIPNDTIKDFIYARQASFALNMKKLDDFEELNAHIDNKYLNSRLMKEYQITWTKINNPDAISDAIKGKNTDFNNDILANDNFISKKIKQHLGKVHVIDIWAPWCRACIVELPIYKSLISEFDPDDVMFSFVCSNGDEQEVSDILEKYELSRERNYICTKEELQYIYKTFSPIGFPNGILVNRKGVIVDHGPHVRPDLIKDKIKLLLQQDKLIK
jgi:thiol-disulfide isomerase/thioredoxin